MSRVCPLIDLGGSREDDKKTLCLPPKRQRNTLISIGSKDAWSFELDAVLHHGFGRVLSFDCTLPHGTPQKLPDSIRDHVEFYNICIAGSNYKDASGRQFVDWQTLLQLGGLRRAPPLVKIDAEGYEFEMMRSLLAAPPQMQPEQLIIEVHAFTMHDPKRFRTAGEVLAYFQAAVFRGSYILINREHKWHRKWGCTYCAEVTMLKATNASLVCGAGHLHG